MRYAIITTLLLSSVLSLTVVALSVQGKELPIIEHGAIGAKMFPFESGSMFFVGDIMLGRRVETLSNQFGTNFAFQSTSTQAVLTDTQVTIGNLEGPVPREHVHTPDLTFRFSFKEAFLPELKSQGFDILSLANNHAFDYGLSGYLNTREKCEAYGLACPGHPREVDASSYVYTDVGDTRVAILMIGAVEVLPDADLLRETLDILSEESDVQVAYVHWGDEYVRTHSPLQEALAKRLIDGGIDAVIGHHPHVVQDIGMYNGKPIFYSLGNFIFDQYFSDDVQEGTGVRMDITETSIVYTIVPFESRTVRSQPRVYEENGALALIGRIVKDLPVPVSIDGTYGSFAIPR